MKTCWNKKEYLYISGTTAKSSILLIFLWGMIGLNGWQKDAVVSVSKVQLPNTSMNPQNEEKKFLDEPGISSIKPFTGIEMTSRQKNAESRYRPIILAAADRYNVDPAIIKAIIMAELGFNPKAVSKVGARGLMQLMPRTARSLGVEDSFKPAHNIDAGVRYFKQLLDQFDGEIELALAAYNAGSYNVKKHGGIPPFKATQFYIDKVLKYYQAYRTT